MEYSQNNFPRTSVWCTTKIDLSVIGITKKCLVYLDHVAKWFDQKGTIYGNKEGDERDTLCDKGKKRFMYTNMGAIRKIRCRQKRAISEIGKEANVQVHNVMIHFVKSCSGIFAVHLSAHHKAPCVLMARTIYLSVSELKACQNVR